jgi:hypothetical protein
MRVVVGLLSQPVFCERSREIVYLVVADRGPFNNRIAENVLLEWA